MIKYFIKKQHPWIYFALMGSLAAWVLRPYWVCDATFILGLITLPFTFHFEENKKSERWVVAVVFLLLSTFFLSSYTFFYLAIVAGFLWVFERHFGRQTLLPLAIFITISPVFKYLTAVFSFDIRLFLTHIAAKVLRWVDPSVLAVGNVIQSKGKDWQIDEACMGLNMLGLGLILTYFFMAHHGNYAQKRATLRGILFSVSLSFLLNLGSNLIRIITLVNFKIPPGTSGHEIVGLLSLGVYTLLPLYFLIRKSTQFNWFFKPNNAASKVLIKNKIM